MKATLIGHPVGNERESSTSNGYAKSYRAFYVERVSIESEEFMKGDTRKIIDETKNAVEGSQVLAYVPTNVNDSLAFSQEFLLMNGVENDGTTQLELAISGELFTAITPYALFEVQRVETAQKQKKPEPTVAPIDYDENIGLGKKEKEAEYTGNGAGFEL